jgi:hypothetical protein
MKHFISITSASELADVIPRNLGNIKPLFPHRTVSICCVACGTKASSTTVKSILANICVAGLFSAILRFRVEVFGTVFFPAHCD